MSKTRVVTTRIPPVRRTCLVSVTLVRVSLMLATFSALNLAAAAASDAAHKERFVRPMLDEVVRGLAAREAYLGARRRGLP